MEGLFGGHSPGHPVQNQRLRQLQSPGCRSGQDGQTAEGAAAEEGNAARPYKPALVSGHLCPFHSKKPSISCECVGSFFLCVINSNRKKVAPVNLTYDDAEGVVAFDYPGDS